MNKYLSNSDIAQVAKDSFIEFALLKAVILIETSGTGFDRKTGLILLQFEPHVFQKATGKRIINGVESQSKEWAAFKEAAAINKVEALEATSWGLGQIMGFNHELAGYKTVTDMVNAFELSEYWQLQGMVSFIKKQPKMINALKTKDWATFARLYNGPGYKKNDYDTKLALAYEKAKAIKIE